MHHPLRDDALRTPEQRFAALPGYPWKPHYLARHICRPSTGCACTTWTRARGMPGAPGCACMATRPGVTSTARLSLLAAGDRAVAPDMPGFGKSDKPKKDARHTFTWHRQVLLEFVERLDLRHVGMVVQDWGGLLGLTLPMAAPQRYDALLAMNTTRNLTHP